MRQFGLMNNNPAPIAVSDIRPVASVPQPTPSPRPPAYGRPVVPTSHIPSFKTGTDRVTKTGPALLHKDEAVLNTKDAAKFRKEKGSMAHEYKHAVEGSLAGHKEEKPKKEIHEMHIKKSHNGGHIIRHEHTRPEHHPDETHTTKTDDELANHVMQNMGTPNPGEAEADAGQGGAPDASGAPPAGGMPGVPSPVQPA